MTSVLNVDTIADKAGTGPVALTKQHAPKMWVHFDGTASGATAQDSFGLASMTDNGTGDYSCAMTNAMGNANYCFHCSIEMNTGTNTNNFGSKDGNAQTTSVIRVAVGDEGASIDTDEYCVTILGDLA